MTLNASIRVAFGESPGLWTLLAGISGGLFIYAIGRMAWPIANLTTSNLGTNTLGYASPVIALVLLWIFSQAEVSKPDLLVIGAVAVVASNLLINFEGEIRWGFRPLLLSLGICGAFMYLREGFFALLAVQGWQWTSGGYFESITLSATVFTLLLAFRGFPLGQQDQRGG